jgi:hypothetical protein
MNTTPSAYEIVKVSADATRGMLAGYVGTCKGCGFVISYTWEPAVAKDMSGHCANYCKGRRA